jgi:ATP-dependent Clp protease ATP-binding subunit ClpB
LTVGYVFPAWAREIQTLLPACSHFVLSGNVHDVYFGPSEGSGASQLMELPQLVGRAVSERGIRLVLTYELETGVSVLERGLLTDQEIVEIAGAAPDDLCPPDRLPALLSLLEQMASSSTEPFALVIKSASRLARNAGDLSEAEFAFFRGAERACRIAETRRTNDGRVLNSPVIWIAESDRDLPGLLTLRNESLRSISVPLPDSADRRNLAANLLQLPFFGGSDNTVETDRSERVLTEQTAGMTLSSIANTVWIARDQGLALDQIEDAARSYRVGIVENPWRADFIADRLRAEFDPVVEGESGTTAHLSDRVIGQPLAVQKALDILLRSAAGLTAAQAGPSAVRPRGVLFFAGPTGVGKTELAKAITKLLFDDERFYVRFDMSEFSAEHSADRLIGSPPGYVGHDAGGELTNAIRERPFSVVLFDEIEKAHERILDKFLQVLDDGRLTDGRGETVYFTEAVIIFTSNLGIYQEVRETRNGTETLRRELAISKETHPTAEERSHAIKQAIRDHFTLRLGRPELLNRIGDDNIVVFDFIDEPTAAKIFAGMLANVSARLLREHGFELGLTAGAIGLVRQACLSDDVLAMGGRGIGAKLETAVINPIARLITLSPRSPQESTAISLDHRDNQWSAQWT